MAETAVAIAALLVAIGIGFVFGLAFCDIRQTKREARWMSDRLAFIDGRWVVLCDATMKVGE